MTLFYYTNLGKVRTNNEDGVLVGDIVVLDSMDDSVLISEICQKLVVVDGMGGSDKGEVATKVFLENMNMEKINTEDNLIRTIEKTQEALKGIDTGCATAGLLIGEENFVFNVGDCRVYKKQDVFLNKLTQDHSYVQNLINLGEITEEEALVHPKKNVLTSAITATSKVDVYFKKLFMEKDDIFLICSDGLWGEFGIDELEECFESDNLSEIHDSLYRALWAKELHDNISYILLKV